MDGIQTIKGYPAPPSPVRTPLAPLAFNPAAVKTTAHYLRALRRRIWVVLATAVPLAILGSILVLRLPPVYVVKAEIEINPPAYDPTLAVLVSHELGRHDQASQDRYIPNRAAQLRSRALAELVVSTADLAPELSRYEDPFVELFDRHLSVVQVQKNSNSYLVSLEGHDAARTTKLLEKLLEKFQDEAKRENEKKIDDTAKNAQGILAKLEQDRTALDGRIDVALQRNPTIGPSGKSIVEEQYVSLGTILNQKQLRLGELHQQMMVAQMFPRFEAGDAAARAAQLASLKKQLRQWTHALEQLQRTSRRFNSDPAAINYAHRLEGVMAEIEELKSIKTEMAPSSTEMIMDQYRLEIEADRDQQANLLSQLRDSLPSHQRFLALLEERQENARRIADLKEKLARFDMLSKSQAATDFIKIPTSLAEPTIPIKPNRPLLIALALILSVAMGSGLVCWLEHVDHSVKVPEHASHTLALPLLGVVPRIPRTVLTQWGRHLWTPGAADSIAADAYRNVRAGLLGVADRRGPIITLLITSAKAGEGKSTTALNLAATCALAGERTVLVDVDLRRPSLGEVFLPQRDPKSAPGVADVLRGKIAWQRTLRHTRIDNLDFIPTGDTSQVPIEALGTRELRQFLLALSHHYDRVLLDGPAVLGLADCRFLGRMVDASLLVVRSGSHHLTTLHRAKAMLEQSHVTLAGVVFNGLTEDMDNWSSYGSSAALTLVERIPIPALMEEEPALAAI
jgi:capsular exopolysaccharide synthesis family protein